jgi:diguanylate cyclase (GGDEF)-like protein
MRNLADQLAVPDGIPGTDGRRPSARLYRVLPPPQADQTVLAEWARSIAAAAERRVAELEARLAYLEGLATTDELTSALNRRGFLIEFSRAVAATRRGGPPGAVIICDLDGFKAVNDGLGHGAGNSVLRQVAQFLMRRIRRMDVAARLGGDEFALLLIGASEASAQRKCQVLARALEAAPLQICGKTVALSASFGFAIFDGSEDEETVLHRADMAMYEEKRRRQGQASCAEAVSP